LLTIFILWKVGETVNEQNRKRKTDFRTYD
jgi:hypothetical protein